MKVSPAIPVILIIILISSVHSLIISEIHANPEGNDKGREWIEIYNNGWEVNLSGFRFYENDVKHRLKLIQGNWILKKGEFAIIAENPEEFLKEYDYTGTLLDSSWGSLKNSGEYIGIMDKEGNIVYGINYSEAKEGYSICIEDRIFQCRPNPGTFSHSALNNSADNKNESNLNGKKENIKEENLRLKKESVENNSKNKKIMRRNLEIRYIGKAKFNSFLYIQLKVSNIDETIVQVEDSNNTRISDAVKFYSSGNFTVEFPLKIYSSCNLNLTEPFYIVAYFDNKMKKERVVFERENCSSTKKEKRENKGEKFKNEKMTVNKNKEGIFRKFLNFLSRFFNFI